MAAIAGTYITTSAKGLREDLTDAIYQISPEKTPFSSMIGRADAKATLHEWQTDALAAPDAANFRNEGNDATFSVPTATTRIGNVNQISDKTAIVSGTLEEVRKAGRKSEMAYQMSQRAAELKRDIETIALSNQAAVSADPRKTGGLPAWVKTNTSFGATGANPVYTTLPNAARTDGTLRSITEAFVKTVMQSCFDQGAEPSVLMVGSAVKVAVSAFAGNATKTLNLAGAKPGVIVQSMDVIVTDFGNLKVVPNRFQRSRDAWLIDPEYLSLMFLRGFHQEPLAKTGDAVKRIIRAEWGLKVHNEAAQGLVTDIQP